MVIVGVGLIGSSLGMNIIRKKLASEVIGVGRSSANLKLAVKRRAIHRAVSASKSETLFKKLTSDDLVILAAPIQGILKTLTQISQKPLVTDVGSTKEVIVKEAAKRRLRFVGGHPIAGTEKNGAAAGELDLFKKRICILTPSQVRQSDLQKISKLWKAVGSKVIFMDVKTHDRIFAAVSHLPHVLAYSLSLALPSLIKIPGELKFAFSSLRGMTRVAESSPEMWRDIFVTNRKALLKVLDRYLADVNRLRSLITRPNARSLQAYLQKAQKVRLKMSAR